MEGYKIATEQLKEMISAYEVNLKAVTGYTDKRRFKEYLDILKLALENIEKDWVEYGENSERG